MRRPFPPLILALIGFSLSALAPHICSAGEQLVYQGNLNYLGAFRVPQLGSAGDQNSFDYGGTSLSFNATNNSLFMVGFSQQQALAEISIPTLGTGPLSGLKVSSLLQNFKDPTEGKLSQINPTDPNSKLIGGTLVYNNKLYLTGYSYYDGSGTQSKTIFARPLNLSTAGQVQGPYAVGNQYQGFVSGYMTPIPATWQASLGGPMLIGNCCLAIAGIQSNGPAASVFSPASVGVVDPVPATPVVGYPSTNPLAGWGTTNPLYNGSTHVTGIVFPNGTRSVLFFGRHGVGTFCYGPGTSDASLAGTTSPSGDPWCYDPTDSSKGTHAYPYKHQVWAYDANDLLTVKNGTKAQYAIVPYAVWNFDLPYDGGGMDIGGAAYDPQTGRIYVSQLYTDVNSGPVIHVFQVGTGTATSTIPSVPTNLQAH